MAGKIKQSIDKIFAEKAKGDTIIANSIKVKLILKGINVDSYNALSPDDPAVLEKLKIIAKDFGVII